MFCTFNEGICCVRRDGLMVSALDSGSNGLGSSSGCVLGQDRTEKQNTTSYDKDTNGYISSIFCTHVF